MTEPLYLRKENRSVNEPKVHPMVKKSFVFVPSAGMRLAPEVLVLELMREVFYERHYGDPTGTRDLNPNKSDDQRRLIYSPAEQAVLHSLRGRRKSTKNSASQSFFAPAYPSLAASSWLSKKRERVICNFLLGGPVAQHLWGSGSENEAGIRLQETLADNVGKALLGRKSCLVDGPAGTDILAATLGAGSFNEEHYLSMSNSKLLEKTGPSDLVMRVGTDELAERITNDLMAICAVEGRIPRMQWLQLLMTFLRFAMPMWLLAQMQITSLLHGWLLTAIDDETIVDAAEISKSLAHRNRTLLHPTVTATRELIEHINSYMKSRVELNILLYCLEEVRSERVAGKRITMDGAGASEISVQDLLVLARDASDDLRNLQRYQEVHSGLSVQRFLTREGEQFSAWRNPVLKGQSKNIDEFFRVLYRAEVGDEEGGYLLIPEGRGVKRGFRVFPGQLLLKTATYLAAQQKWSRGSISGEGKLVLQDVENLFAQYGIDFSSAADARPLLMRELQAMGLLTGSPDAGSSVAVACPY